MTVVTTTPTVLDPGTAFDATVINTGSFKVRLRMDGGPLGYIYDETLQPGQVRTVNLHGYPLSAFTESGTSSVNVTTSGNPQGSIAREAGQLDAAVASGTYQPRSSAPQTVTYNADGTVATVTENDTGAVITYTYNTDLTPATESRVLSGVTTTRTFTYTSGNLTAVA